MVAALDKGMYRLSLDRKVLKNIINGNLLKSCYDRIRYELIIIMKYKNL